MRRLKVAFTIRSLMIAVALVALNLAGPIATWNRVLAKAAAISANRWRSNGFRARRGASQDSYRSAALETGERLVRVVEMVATSGRSPKSGPRSSPVCRSPVLVFLVPLILPTASHRSNVTIAAW